MQSTFKIRVTKQQPGKPCGVFTIARAMEDNRMSPVLSELRM
jgi:hypothetical protein